MARDVVIRHVGCLHVPASLRKATFGSRGRRKQADRHLPVDINRYWRLGRYPVFPTKFQPVSHAAGANKAIDIYQPDITSYDYDCPVGEAGGYGQPGIGGPNKFEVLGVRFPYSRKPYSTLPTLPHSTCVLPSPTQYTYAQGTLAACLCQHSALAAEVLRSPACKCFATPSARRATALNRRALQLCDELLWLRPGSCNRIDACDDVAACFIWSAHLQW